jgi:hypothetical protein
MTRASFLQNRLGCSSEGLCTRNLSGGFPDSSVFTPVEEKLVRLGLDRAAHQGESDACAVKLFRSFRKRGLTAEQLMRSSAQSIWAARELMAARGRVVGFGKYRGKTVGELPLDYIRWALSNYRDMPFNLRRAMRTVLDAKN